jgi:hypothetical protein
MSQKKQVIVDTLCGTSAFPIQNKSEDLYYRFVDLRPIKQFLLENAREDLPLKKILLAEPDFLPLTLYIARLPLYIKLCEFKRR